MILGSRRGKINICIEDEVLEQVETFKVLKDIKVLEDLTASKVKARITVSNGF